MPKLRPRSSHSEMIQALMAAAEADNGKGGPTGLPNLTNSDALAVIEWMSAESKRLNKLWPGWYELTLLALGYFKEGDKFKIDPKHARALFPEDSLVLFWETELQPQAFELAPAKPKRFGGTKGGQLRRFRRAATIAWERLKRDKKLWPIDPIKLIPKRPRLFGKGMGLLLILILVAAATSTKGD